MSLNLWEASILVALGAYLVEWHRAPLRVRWFEMLLGVGPPLILYFAYRTYRRAQIAETGPDSLTSIMPFVDFFLFLLFAWLCVAIYQKLTWLHLNRVASGEPWD